MTNLRPTTKHGNAAALARKIKEHRETSTFGGKWFSPGTMEFFDSRIETGLLSEDQFISSEQFNDSEPRLYTIRRFVHDDYGTNVETVGDFQQYNTLADALKATEIER